MGVKLNIDPLISTTSTTAAKASNASSGSSNSSSSSTSSSTSTGDTYTPSTAAQKNQAKAVEEQEKEIAEAASASSKSSSSSTSSSGTTKTNTTTSSSNNSAAKKNQAKAVEAAQAEVDAADAAKKEQEAKEAQEKAEKEAKARALAAQKQAEALREEKEQIAQAEAAKAAAKAEAEAQAAAAQANSLATKQRAYNQYVEEYTSEVFEIDTVNAAEAEKEQEAQDRRNASIQQKTDQYLEEYTSEIETIDDEKEAQKAEAEAQVAAAQANSLATKQRAFNQYVEEYTSEVFEIDAVNAAEAEKEQEAQDRRNASIQQRAEEYMLEDVKSVEQAQLEEIQAEEIAQAQWYDSLNTQEKNAYLSILAAIDESEEIYAENKAIEEEKEARLAESRLHNAVKAAGYINDDIEEVLQIDAENKAAEEKAAAELYASLTTEQKKQYGYMQEEQNEIAAIEKDNKLIEETKESSKDAALADVEAELARRYAEVEAEANSQTGLGAAWNNIKGVFNGGTKGETKEIEELYELYQEALNGNYSVDELYYQVFGTEYNFAVALNIQEAQSVSACLTTGGGFQTSTGETIDNETVVECLREQIDSLSEYFDETVDSQGWLSSSINWVNKNITGIGTTENMTRAQIEQYYELVNKLAETTDSTEFAAIYKSITGEELTLDSLNGLLSGSSKVENSTVAESIMDYESTQESAVNGVTGAISGIVSSVAVAAATVLTGGAALPLIATVAIGAAAGGTTTVAIKSSDAATQNNGKTILENLQEYAETDLVKDFAVGAINGATNQIGNATGSLFTSATKKITKSPAGKVASFVVSNFTDGFADGALSAGAEYIIDCVSDGEKINFSDLAESALIGGTFGGLTSVGMSAVNELGGKIVKTIDTKLNKLADSVETSGYKTDTTIKTSSDSNTTTVRAAADTGVDTQVRAIGDTNATTGRLSSDPDVELAIRKTLKDAGCTENEINNFIKVKNYEGFLIGEMQLTPEKYDAVQKALFGEAIDPGLHAELSEIGQKFNTNIYCDNNLVSLDYVYKNGVVKQGCTLDASNIEYALEKMTDAGQKIPDNIYLTSLFPKNAEGNYIAGGGFNPINSDAISVNVLKTSEPYIRYTIYHESAHWADYNAKKPDYYYYRSQWSGGDISNFDTGIVKTTDVAQKISNYATTNNQEFVAEVTALITDGTIIQSSNGDYIINPDKIYYRDDNNMYYLNTKKRTTFDADTNNKINEIMNIYNQLTDNGASIYY